jgi:hypothetical protein
MTLEEAAQKVIDMYWDEGCGGKEFEMHLSILQDKIHQEKKPHVQVSAFDFVEMVFGKEELVGRPVFWAEWPGKEKE